MSAYLTPTEAASRLSRYGITQTVEEGDLDAASGQLDALAPFFGDKTDSAQENEFPRDGDTVVPDAVLDWVALRAYQLSTDEGPPVERESAGRVSSTYALPKLSQTEKRMGALLHPYLSHVGRQV